MPPHLSFVTLAAFPLSLCLQPADEFPLAKSTEEFMQWSVMPRDHMNYALTWFTLSAAVSGLAVKAIRQGVRAAPK